MTDGVERIANARFIKAENSSFTTENNLGISGVWFVGGSRDYFTGRYVGETLVGFECYNCCGTWSVSI
jgi:hypothetical protein